MTVSTTTSKAGPYAGAGTVGPFTVNFPFIDDTYLTVIKTSATGVNTTLTYITDYVVSGAGGSSGSVTLTVALPVGEKLTIVRSVPATQETDYVQNDAFPAESHEEALDKLTMLVQQVGETVGRALVIPATDVNPITEIPNAASRANSFLAFDVNGNPIATVPNPDSAPAVAMGLANLTAFVNQYIADLASASDQAKGPALVGYNPSLNYAVRTVGGAFNAMRPNMMWFITSAAERAAIKNYTTTTDHTALINGVMALTGSVLYLPEGRWNIDTDTGMLLGSGFNVTGDGLRTMIYLAGKGGTTSDLVNYVKGSGVKRAFTPGVANAYVMGGYMADLSIIMTPQTPYNASNYKQIGLDLRNITRSVIERVYVGNNPDSQTHPWAPRSISAVDQTQGWGIVCGTRVGGTDYCGGEGNTIRNCMPWGLFKNIAIDDSVLSPLSSAHATLVEDCDVQGGHELITQGLSFAAGVVIRGVTIQGNRRQSGNANPTIGISVSGYNCFASVRYAEMGTACDTLFTFSSTAKECVGELLYYTSTSPSTATIVDAGVNMRNRLRYPAPVVDTGVIPNVTTGFGAMLDLYNRAYLEATYKGSWSGAVETVDSAYGMTVTRAGAGDYTLTMSPAQPNANWSVVVTGDANSSGNPLVFATSFGTQSTGSVRFFTYSQNAGTTTQIDPRKMHIRVRQAIT